MSGNSSGIWGGFDNSVIANRQKDTYIHGFLDVSGQIKTQSFLTMQDGASSQSFPTNTILNSYTLEGTYKLDGLQTNAILVAPNIVAGNSSILTTANLVPLGCNIYIPKFANVAYSATVPLGYELTFNTASNVYYGNTTYSTTLLNATTNSNIGNITLFQTQDYLKANCSYSNEAMTIPLGISLNGSINLANSVNANNGATYNITGTAVTSTYSLGNFTILKFGTAGTSNITFDNDVQIGYVVVGGGGAGGAKGSGSGASSAGAGGGIAYASYSMSTTILSKGVQYTITVGGGGASSTSEPANSGSSSSISGTGITTITVNGGSGGQYTNQVTNAAGGSASGGLFNITGGAGGKGGYNATVGYDDGAAINPFTIDFSGTTLNYFGGGGGGGQGTTGATGTTLSGGGGAGALGGGGNGSYGNAKGVDGTANTGGGGGGAGYLYVNSAGSGGGSGVVYLCFINSLYNNQAYSKVNSTLSTNDIVTATVLTVPPYYSGNAISVYVPIAANISFAPSTAYTLQNNANITGGNTISFQTNITNIYANVYKGNNTGINTHFNTTITPSISSNIFIRNTSATAITFSTTAANLILKQYLYTANITFTPVYSTVNTNYTVKCYTTANIYTNIAAVNSAFCGNIEFNTPLLTGNLNSTTAGTSSNYSLGSVTVGGNNNTGGITPSYLIGGYSYNTNYITSFNANKPNIQLTYAPNVFLLNSANTMQYNLGPSEFANNYIKTIQIPNLDTIIPIPTNYTANIILGNINIPPSTAIFANINTTDVYKLSATGNLKVTVNNFPATNNIANITTYANPQFTTSTGTGIFANSTTGSINTVNFNGYNALSGNISLSKTFLNYNLTAANITIMDEVFNVIGNVPATAYYVNGVIGTTPNTLSTTYSNVVAGAQNQVKNYIGNVSFTYTLPTNNIYNKTYTAYLSLNGNISAPYNTNIMSANVYSNVVTMGFVSTSDTNIISSNKIVSAADLETNIYTNVPVLIGNVFMNTLTANDVTVSGSLKVRQYQAKNIINTTTTNYNQLVVSEDLSLNGRLNVSGNVICNGIAFTSSNLSGASKIMTGTVTISSSGCAANTVVSQLNQLFGNSFSSPPVVVGSIGQGTGGECLSVMLTNITTTKFDVYVKNNSTTTSVTGTITVNWIAIGSA